MTHKKFGGWLLVTVKVLVLDSHIWDLDREPPLAGLLLLQLLQLSLVLGEVLVLGVVLGGQLVELGLLVVDHVLQDAVGSRPLLLGALGAVGGQGVGQQALQLAGIGGALSLVHQTPEVVVEQALRLEDLLQVDVVEAGRVGLLGQHGSDDHGEEASQEEFHGDRAGGRGGGKGITLLVSPFGSRFAYLIGDRVASREPDYSDVAIGDSTQLRGSP